MVAAAQHSNNDVAKRTSARQLGSMRIVPETDDIDDRDKGLNLSRQTKGTYIDFIKGYVNSLGGPAKSSTAMSKRNPRQAFGAFDSLGITSSDLRRNTTRQKGSDHYRYFANMCKDQGINERASLLEEQSTKMHKARSIFHRGNSRSTGSTAASPTAENTISTPTSGKHLPVIEDPIEDEEPDLQQKEARVRSSISKMRWAALKDAVPVLTEKKEPTSPIATGDPGSPKSGGANKGGFMTMLQMVAKRDQKKKEACDSIRFLIFGCLGNEHLSAKDKHKLYEQSRGNKDEIFQLYQVWSQMDEDGSGDVEYQEFLNFFSKNKSDRLLGMRCVKYLVGSGERDGDAGEGGGCTIEDMMKLIWLEAKQEDIHLMLKWFREAAFHQKRVPTPPLLPKRKRRELYENFRWLDRAGTGKITYRDLVDSGLVDEEMAQDLMRKYDTDGSGDLDGEEFLELLCPNGYRAHSGVREAVDAHGAQLTYISNSYFTGWTVEGAMESLPSQFVDGRYSIAARTSTRS
eukprot:gnl/MRDRNA2_/MRDRNA2_106158_c0_seq1.p1 gnl/MRDRNA2_/MRDRNA2_106158_c0~~gnl/MRDRNA2_/MRDRNA2_106158_c0_seq1.p1  ORF type:complete len:516 (+),score=101.78 gnl/MRDRNA2_/MRDRNA2_106158_c0_seq1:176-1723(+)